jgi:peptidylamidoglycolate lyase
VKSNCSLACPGRIFWLFISLLMSAPTTLQAGPQSRSSIQTGNASGVYQIVHGWPDLSDDFVLGHVTGVAVDSHNHVFAFHRAEHSILGKFFDGPITSPAILCFDGRTGKVVTSWGAGIFFNPHGLRVDSRDNVWATDIQLHQVFKFSHDGKLLLTAGEKNVPGLDGAHFNKPTDVAVASDGSFYVSDGYGNSRVAKFSSDGKFLFDWGHKGSKPGEFNTPHGITLDAEGRVYVADRSNGRIQVFQGDGTFLHEWKSADLGRPWAVTVAPDGSLYVVDGGDLHDSPPERNHILKLDLEGHIVEKWARFGNYDGQIYWGHDIAVGRDGAVYVGDILGRRVQKFAKH